MLSTVGARNFALASGLAALLLLVWEGGRTYNHPCAASVAIESLRVAPSVDAPTPEGCRLVHREVPEGSRSRIAQWQRMYGLDEPTIALCLSSLARPDVLQFYFRRDQEWAAQGYEPIRVGERFDGFVSGRRFMFVVLPEDGDEHGTLIVLANTTRGRLRHLRQALHWCDRSVYGQGPAPISVAEDNAAIASPIL